MADNLWDDQEEPFNDMPEEAQTSADGRPVVPSQETVYSPPSRAPISRQPAIQEEAPEEQEEYEDLLPSLGLDDIEGEEDLLNVLNDAHLRLEQGNLWRVIINHDLFAGSDADPKAIQNVQAEIRKFAKERMEIMLGMRRETAEVERLEIDFPFNDKEVTALKDIAYKLTKGESANSDRYVPEVRRVKEEVPTVPKRTSLNTIGSTNKKASALAPTSRQAPKQAAPAKKPLPARATTPIKRSKLDMTIDQICREEGVPRELLEENIRTLKKPAHELTDQELLERNKEAARRRGTQVPSSAALPMPTPEQMEALAISHAGKIASGAGMSRIIDAVKKMPIKNP